MRTTSERDLLCVPVILMIMSFSPLSIAGATVPPNPPAPILEPDIRICAHFDSHPAYIRRLVKALGENNIEVVRDGLRENILFTVYLTGVTLRFNLDGEEIIDEQITALDIAAMHGHTDLLNEILQYAFEHGVLLGVNLNATINYAVRARHFDALPVILAYLPKLANEILRNAGAHGVEDALMVIETYQNLIKALHLRLRNLPQMGAGYAQVAAAQAFVANLSDYFERLDQLRSIRARNRIRFRTFDELVCVTPIPVSPDSAFQALDLPRQEFVHAVVERFMALPEVLQGRDDEFMRLLARVSGEGVGRGEMIKLLEAWQREFLRRDENGYIHWFEDDHWLLLSFVFNARLEFYVATPERRDLLVPLQNGVIELTDATRPVRVVRLVRMFVVEEGQRRVHYDRLDAGPREMNPFDVMQEFRQGMTRALRGILTAFGPQVFAAFQILRPRSGGR